MDQRESYDKKISNLKNKHSDAINKLNLENFGKLKELNKKIETLESEKTNVQKEDKSDKNQNKTFTAKDLNEKVKQKTAIIEFNLKKD